MDRRQKQKLERDLERYHALLKLATDERAAAALRQLIRETQGRLNHTNNSEQPTPQIRDDNQSPAERLGSGGLEHMSAQPDWPRNRLLLALPSLDLKELIPELEQIRCEREQVLVDADSSLDHVFFPDSGVVSAVAVYTDGSIIEMATIGREGCTAVQAVFGAESSSVRLLVQIPGGAAKMSRAGFTRAMGTMPSFRSLMYAYVQAFLEQVLVSVACNGAHSLKQRLARWLLTMRDRGDDDALQITQNLLAEMLGVQRPTVTNAARELERAGLIARGRRQVTILDRQGLVAASCECYQLVRARVASHLPKTYA